MAFSRVLPESPVPRAVVCSLLLGLAAAPSLFAADDGAAGASAKSARPNIVLILADDLGQRDLGCYGSTFYETPRINGLAAGGMKFTDAYAACPVCSPTRASIQTGRHPARLHLTDWLKGRRKREGSPILHADYVDALPPGEVTVAERLKTAGYLTGYVGKWHLSDRASAGGDIEDGRLPEDQGYDVGVGAGPWGNPKNFFAPNWAPDVQPEFDGQYLDRLLAEKSAAFIADSAAADAPFFLTFAPYLVHTPIQPEAEKLAKYETKAEEFAAEDASFSKPGGDGREGNPGLPTQNNPHYAAMVESLDDTVGVVLDALDAAGVADETLVVFFSDNGGLAVREGKLTPATTNAPLRAGKGWLYEGGIREPLLVRWPGVVQAGSVSDEPVTSHDLFPTLCAAAGVDPGPAELDGVDLTPLLTGGKAVLDREALYWHYPHFSNQGGRPGGAVRAGHWKLIERYEDGALELFDLKEDEAETNDLAAEQPGKAAELRSMLSGWRQRLDANMPRPNPDYTGDAQPVLKP